MGATAARCPRRHTFAGGEMFTRRAFFKYTAAAGLTLFVASAGQAPRALASIPGGSLAASTIPQFVEPLVIPPVMPRRARLVQRGKNVDYYEIAVRQFRQQILPASLPLTTVWGYGAVSSDKKGRRLAKVFHAPSLSIEARWRTPVRVKWINQLVDGDGHYLPHLLPVDPTLHWANPGRIPGPDGVPRTDNRPSFEGRHYVPPSDYTGDPATYTDYQGPVPLATHVHGAVGVGDESDGYTEAWYLPAATNIPGGYARHGRWYPFFARKAKAGFGVTWGDGYAVAQYPNLNLASTLWYHDHTLGMTRLNVYAGPAGFFLLRGGPGGDGKILDSRTGAPAVLPGPAPKAGELPGAKQYREIPLAIQDRSFNADGSLFYPDSRAFFDGLAGPYIPDGDIPPVWNPEFFGNTLMVNGRTWPYLDVEQRRYRFRVLNGCQSRFLILDFGQIPGIAVWQVATEGGLLPAPIDVGVVNNGQVLLGPAERADLIVDFTQVPVGSHVLLNEGPDEPYGGGEPDDDFESADAATTGRVLQFRVGPATRADRTTPPEFLVLPSLPPLPPETLVRRVALMEHMSDHEGHSPIAAMLGVIHGDPAAGPAHLEARMWADPVTQNPQPGATEVREIYNATADAHPIHVHEVTFEVVNRQRIELDEMGHSVRLSDSPPRPAMPWEAGRKDTVIAYPGEVTRIRARFATAGQYVWHCHIVEHEDNEMMLPLRVGPVQPGQPLD